MGLRKISPIPRNKDVLRSVRTQTRLSRFVRTGLAGIALTAGIHHAATETTTQNETKKDYDSAIAICAVGGSALEAMRVRGNLNKKVVDYKSAVITILQETDKELSPVVAKNTSQFVVPEENNGKKYAAEMYLSAQGVLASWGAAAIWGYPGTTSFRENVPAAYSPFLAAGAATSLVFADRRINNYAFEATNAVKQIYNDAFSQTSYVVRND